MKYVEELLKALKAFLSKEDYPLIENIFTSAEEGSTMKGKFSEAIWESFRKGKNEGLSEGQAEGLAKGRAEGVIEGIVMYCQEENKTFPDAVNKIMRRLSLPAAEAEQRARQYWNG